MPLNNQRSSQESNETTRSSKRLDPLESLGAFDGENNHTELKTQRCDHRDIRIVSSNEARCKCGAAYTGPNIQKLVEILKNRNLQTS